MLFRWIGLKKAKPAKASRQVRLSLESLEDRCVPSATDLGAANCYNAFVFTNYTGYNSDVEGKLAVGGNAQLSNYGIGASLPNSHGTQNDLVVGNNLKYTNGEVFNGNVVYGDKASLTGVGVPNGTVSPGTPVNFSAAETDLLTKSTKWSLYGTNGTITDNWGNLSLTGTNSSINIFDLTSSQLQNIWSISINAPAGSTVLVNVSGTSVNMQYFGMSINGTDHTHVLFNLYQATSFSMQGIGFEGNILAPKAAVQFNNGSVTGTLVAQAFCGTGQLDSSAINISVPTSLPAVISGAVFQNIYGTSLPVAGDPGLTPVYVILQGVGTSAFYSTLTDGNGNFSITVTQPGTYTMSIVDATGLGYSLVSLNVGTIGGTASLSSGEIKNIPILGGNTGTEYDFGLNSTGGTGGEHP